MLSKVRPSVENLAVYVPGKPIEEVQRELGLTQVIKLASNENPWGPSPRALQAISKALSEIYLYPDANAQDLKESLGSELAVDANQIIIGNGSEEIVQMIAKTFVDPGDEVVMAAPSFPRYQTVTEMMAGISREVMLVDYRHDLLTMAQQITSRTKVIFVCNPNNPTGTIVTETELDEFMRQVPADILVVFDEAYYEYVADPSFVSGLKYLKDGRRVLILRTFSKAYGLAGLRLGYGIGDAAVIDMLNRVREPFNGNLLAQVAAQAAWLDKEHLQQVLQNTAAGLQQLTQGLARLGLQAIPSHTNFFLVDVGQPSPEVFQALLRQGIIIRPGHLFGYANAIRVTVGTTEQNQAFLQALTGILRR
ncbi:MAG: histidinol-phosphate transaminase [Peptococcaceae bacterium]|nr:histidinol-phosphate transaminase [Peptococcaceae bacterium]